MISIIRKYINEFKLGRPADVAEAELFLDALITETDGSVLASVLVEWNKKGIEEDEIYEFARVLRSREISKREAGGNIAITRGRDLSRVGPRMTRRLA